MTTICALLEIDTNVDLYTNCEVYTNEEAAYKKLRDIYKQKLKEVEAEENYEDISDEDNTEYEICLLMPSLHQWNIEETDYTDRELEKALEKEDYVYAMLETRTYNYDAYADLYATLEEADKRLDERTKELVNLSN